MNLKDKNYYKRKVVETLQVTALIVASYALFILGVMYCNAHPF